MSTDETRTNDGDQASEPDVEPAPSLPTLTVRAAGPASFQRQIDDSGPVDAVAIHHDVDVTISRDLRGPGEFLEFVETDHHGKIIVNRRSLIDQLLSGLERDDGYSRAGAASDWSVTIEGSASEWKQFALALVDDEQSSSDVLPAKEAVWKLHTLVEAEVTNAGAVLALLDLVDEHDLDVDCTSFVARIQEADIGCT